jgi:hypothetical protein
MNRRNLTMKTVVIDGVEYTEKTSHVCSPVRIVVLQRGWVCVGRWGQDGSQCWLNDAHVIERWGTTKGIGELVTGPTAKTVLRHAGHVRFHELAIVLTVSCKEAAWTDKL